MKLSNYHLMKSKEFSQFISTFLNIRRYFIAVSPNSKRFRGCVSLKKKKKKVTEH